jgi:hypothetical protein
MFLVAEKSYISINVLFICCIAIYLTFSNYNSYFRNIGTEAVFALLKAF